MKISTLVAVASSVSFTVATPYPAVTIDNGNNLVARVNDFFAGQREQKGDPGASPEHEPPPIVPGPRSSPQRIPQDGIPVILEINPRYSVDDIPIVTGREPASRETSIFVNDGERLVTVTLSGDTYSMTTELHVRWTAMAGTDTVTFGTGAVERMQTRRQALQFVIRSSSGDGPIIAQFDLAREGAALQLLSARETISLYNLHTLAFQHGGAFDIQQVFNPSENTLPMHLSLAPAQLTAHNGLPAPEHQTVELPMLLRLRPGVADTPDEPSYRIYELLQGQEEDAAHPPAKRGLKAARDMPFSQIVALEQQARAGQADSVTAESAQFQLFYYAFQSVQANISAAIFPILDEITTGTNCSMIYTMAWTIWADLTAANTQAVGSPFWNGRHAFDDLEQQYLAKNKVSEDDEEYKKYLAVNSILIDLYQYAWAKSVAAANSTGMLGQLRILAANLATNDTKIQTPGFGDVNPGDSDTQYFVTYNRTQVS